MPGSKPGALPLGDTPISGERVFVRPRFEAIYPNARAYCLQRARIVRITPVGVKHVNACCGCIY